MNASSDGLRLLAAHLGGEFAANPQRLRQDLEACLVPLIRSAIRTGVGAPPLVQWVRRHLPAAPSGRPAGAPRAPAHDPDATAPAMARQLCAVLIRHYQGRPGQETVVGR